MTAQAATRGIRNNNPGNIEIGAPWQGLMPRERMTAAQAAETRFCVFEDPTWGIRAIARILITYQDKRRARDGSPIDTLEEIIERWAPPSENDTDAYVRHLRQVLGIEPGRQLDVHRYETMRALVIGIVRHENSGQQPYTDAQIDKGLVLAGIQPPAGRPSRTMAAGRVAAAATLAAGLVDAVGEQAAEISVQLKAVAPYVSWVGIALTVVAFCAIARMIYARWDDRRRGVNP